MAKITEEGKLIFVSYSHKDKGWINALGFDREPGGTEDAKFWIDRNLLHAGDRWDENATRALAGATAAVLLISPSFLSSEAIIGHELPVILDRYRQGDLSVVFVPIGDLDTNEVGRALGIPNIHNLLSIPAWNEPLPQDPEPRGDVRREIVSAATEPLDVQNLRRNLHPKYQLQDSLGNGPLGRVFTANDSQLQRSVAIKLLHKTDCDRHFKSSVRKVVRATDHTNILSVYGAYLDAIPPHYVRQYESGDSLRDLLDRSFRGLPLPVSMVTEFLSAVGAAVHHSFAKGVSGINIRPSNVIVSNSADGASRRFYLSLNSYKEYDLLEDDHWRMNRKDVLYLPVEYRSERMIAEALDPQRADQYRLGLVAYEMLIGSKRFEELASPLRQRFLTPDTWRWPEITLERTNCPDYVCSVIERMIDPDPQERYGNIEAAMNDIEGTDLDVELVRDSYRRLMKTKESQEEFFRTFYLKFLATYSRAKRFFSAETFGELTAEGPISDGWQRQFQALKEAVLLLAVFDAFHEQRREPNILTRIAEAHASKGIPQALYSGFASVLIEAVAERDVGAPLSAAELKRSWANVIEPGIAYMKRRTEEYEQAMWRSE